MSNPTEAPGFHLITRDLISLVVHGDGTYDLGTDLPLPDAISTLRGIIANLTVEGSPS